ncbi:MAG: GGDEF domain-containing protein, partial [Blautia sp.]|nr:GGDEF domain-containing protein [Blautia sp.]
GDQCLVAVADVLQEFQSDTVFFARYGGDEFVLLYLDYTDEEIRGMADRLSQRVKEVTRKRSLPELSISQGVCNRVPSEKERLWDFSTAADHALYRVKESGRGAVYLYEYENL